MLLYTATLKDGRVVRIRELRMEDKEKFIEMYESLSHEIVRWGMPPYDREVVGRWLGSLSSLIALLAWHDGKIVGHAQVFKFPRARRKGTGDLVIYLHQDFHNVGLGTAMLSGLLRRAKSERMHRISLEVVADNECAVHLYKKVGLKVEGVLKDAYFGEEGKYHDELAMALILE